MATKPTLALIPSGYGTNKVYSVLPSDGSGDFTFGRTGTATRINKDKLIESVGSNIPRLDYTDSGCPSLLLEPQRTNLVIYSEDTTEWDKNETPINTLNTTISPNGSQNADSVIVNSVSEGFYDFSIGTVQSGTSYTFSIFIKYISGVETIRFGGSGSGFGGDNNNVFNIKNGTIVSTVSGNTLSVNDYGNGWYRLIATKTPVVTSSGAWILYGNENTEIQYSAWGVQVEQGSYPTSYIPTTGTSVTRIAETANSSGNASTFNDSEGVLFAEISALADDGVFNAIAISDGGVINRVVIDYDTSNQIRAFYQLGGVPSAFFIIDYDIKLNTKICFKYKVNDFAVWINGFELDSSSSGAVSSGNNLNALNLNFGSNTGGDFYGKTKQIQYFNTALTDLELETLTSFTSFNAMALALNYTIY